MHLPLTQPPPLHRATMCAVTVASPTVSPYVYTASATSSAAPMIATGATTSEVHLYLLLHHANLLQYYTTFIKNGQLHSSYCGVGTE
jgi:hypothetical protein